MAIKLKYTFLAILSVVLFNACIKSAECVQQAGYAFKTPVFFTPLLDEMNVGDTLWISFSHPTTLKDEATGQMIDYSNAENLGTTLQTRRYENGENLGIPNANDVLFIDKIGNTYKEEVHTSWNDHLRHIKIVEQNGNYEFLIGVVPQKKRMQLFYIANGISVTRKNEQRECFGASFNMRVGNLDNHLYYYTQIKPNYAPNNLERYNCYYTQVK
jgi:hypothetical protein